MNVATILKLKGRDVLTAECPKSVKDVERMVGA